MDGRAVDIDRITTSDPSIKARVLVTQLPSEAVDIEVSVALPDGKQLLAGDVVLHFSSSDSREVRIPVTAIRTGSPKDPER